MNPKVLFGLLAAGICGLASAGYQAFVPPPVSYRVAESFSLNPAFMPLIWSLAGYFVVQFIPAGTMRDLLMKFINSKSGGKDIGETADLIKDAIAKGTDLYVLLLAIYESMKTKGADDDQLNAIRLVADKELSKRYSKDFGDNAKR